MTRLYTPEQAERMRKRRYWIDINGKRFSNASAADNYLAKRIFNAACAQIT